MIKAEIVFKNVEGQVVPRERINALPHHEFFSAWTKGKLRRDIEVTIENPDTVEKGLKDFTSKEFQAVGSGVYSAWGELDIYLSLTRRFLAYWVDASPESTPKVKKSYLPIIVPEVKEVKLDPLDTKYYTTYYWLTAEVAHEAEWYARDPKTVIYDMIIELLQQWTMRDNTTLLLLLSQNTGVNDKPGRYETFTPTAFIDLLTLVTRWAIPVPHCIVPAKTLTGLNNDDWPRFCALVNQPDKEALNDSQGRIMHIDVFCIGSPHDAFYPEFEEMPDFYMCGMPASLGIRAVKVEPTMKPLEQSLLGKENRGWLWSTYIGTAVLNSRAVATALVG